MIFKCIVTYYISAETEEDARRQLPSYLKNATGDIEIEDVTYTDVEDVTHDPRTCENSVPCYDCAKAEGWNYGNM